MENKKVSHNFWLSEFNYVMPDYRLLLILQNGIRNYTKSPVTILNSTRTVKEHVQIYKELESKKQIATKNNGLSDIALIDVIPWGSRHLPTFETSYLRAVDIKCKNSNGGYYTGLEIYNSIMFYVESEEFLVQLNKNNFKYQDRFVGIGIGKHFVHIDIDRKKHTKWEYSY